MFSQIDSEVGTNEENASEALLKVSSSVNSSGGRTLCPRIVKDEISKWFTFHENIANVFVNRIRNFTNVFILKKVLCHIIYTCIYTHNNSFLFIAFLYIDARKVENQSGFFLFKEEQNAKTEKTEEKKEKRRAMLKEKQYSTEIIEISSSGNTTITEEENV